MRILLLVDKLNWAYHSIAKSLCKYNTDDNIYFGILPIKGGIDKIKHEWAEKLMNNCSLNLEDQYLKSIMQLLPEKNLL